MGFAAKGDVLNLTASGLNISESFSINEASGTISDSHLAVATENRRLIRRKHSDPHATCGLSVVPVGGGRRFAY